MSEAYVDTEVLTENIERVRERIALACRRAGRRPDEVTLVAVTKVFPLPLLESAYEAGLRHFGESRVQELVEKTESLELPGLTWHLIGHLQRNKAKLAVEHANVFHALDSLRLARTLDRHLEDRGESLPCLVQVNVSGEDSKYGLHPDELRPFLEKTRRFPRLDIRGLMTLAAPAPDPELVRPQFRLLRRLLQEARREDHRDGLHVLSMGMSGDYEVAVEEGATHVRLGTALFGPRPTD